MLDRLIMNHDLFDYVLDVSLRESDLLARLRAETAKMPMAEMQIPAEQGQFMAFLVQLLGARRVVEVGTFTGYSTIWMAQAMPADGKLIACDVSEEWTDVARRYWTEAGLADRIDLRLAPADETLAQLKADGWAGTVDMVFIDADKTGYIGYYEAALELLRPGGVIVLDNMLRAGEVIDPSVDEAGTVVIRDLNKRLHQDERISLSMLPFADGVTLGLKR